MRVRFRFSKLGKVRWTSHRDLARMWERALRRAQLPIVYTGGFSPRPKVSFGLALPTGAESVCEYLDAEFDTSGLPGGLGTLAQPGFEVVTLPARLTPALPTGVDVLAAAVIDDRAESLQQEVTSCRWEIGVTGVPTSRLPYLVEQLLDASSIVVHRERKGHTVADDVRPAVLACSVLSPALLDCELATQPRGLRPSELLRALGPDLEEGSVRRTHQWITRDGARREPLPAGAESAPHAGVRAS